LSEIKNMKSKLRILTTASLILTVTFLLNSCSKKKDDPEPKVVYNNCRIMSVKILEIPANDPSGGGWDISNGPDVFLKINVAGNTVVNTQTNRFNDNTSYPIKWNFVNPLVINNLSVQYDFYIYDYDSPDPDDLMGAMGYVFSKSTDYPSTLILTYKGTKLEVELQWFN
jgi:hypothetical protein